MKRLCLLLLMIAVLTVACANEEPDESSNGESVSVIESRETESVTDVSETSSEEANKTLSDEPSETSSEEASEPDGETSSVETSEDEEKAALVLEKVWIEQETDWISTEHREYNNGYRLDIQICYESEPDIDRVLCVETAFSKDGKYLYRYREEYNAEGEVVWRRYYTYGDPNLGERLALVDMIFDFSGYEGANSINWSEKDKGSGSFSYRNNGTFSYEIEEKDGTRTKCFYIGYELLYCTKVLPIEDDPHNKITEYYDENMSLFVRNTPLKYTEYFLDGGKVLRTVPQNDSYVRSLYLYTEPSDETEPELTYIATYSTNTDKSSFWVQILGDGITQEQAEEYCRIVTTTEKSLKPLQDEWLDAYYRANENS